MILRLNSGIEFKVLHLTPLRDTIHFTDESGRPNHVKVHEVQEIREDRVDPSTSH